MSRVPQLLIKSILDTSWYGFDKRELNIKTTDPFQGTFHWSSQGSSKLTDNYTPMLLK